MTPFTSLPETLITQALNGALMYIENDYKAKVDKSHSILHKLLTTLILGDRYDLVEQAAYLFIKQKPTDRRIEVFQGFNTERNGLPTIHVIIQSEQPAQIDSGIGVDEEWEDSFYEPDEPTQLRMTYSRSYSANYALLITSDNANEITTIFAVVRALMIALIPQLELEGLRKIKFSAQDVRISTEFVEKGFMRMIGISFDYETSGLEFLATALKDIVIDPPKAVDPDQTYPVVDGGGEVGGVTPIDEYSPTATGFFVGEDVVVEDQRGLDGYYVGEELTVIE